jgi:crotonobetainyl-CoA:carnitine CoA-transferase CaiB-like acyl-CoA transferase
VGIISEKHWERFCQVFERLDWLSHPDLKTNNDRITAREWFLSEVEQTMRGFTKQQIIERCEAADIPFAPIAKVEDLFDDPQLNQGGSLLPTTLPDGTQTKLPKFPLEYEGVDFQAVTNPPSIGQHTIEILTSIGYDEQKIQTLVEQKIITRS